MLAVEISPKPSLEPTKYYIFKPRNIKRRDIQSNGKYITLTIYFHIIYIYNIIIHILLLIIYIIINILYNAQRSIIISLDILPHYANYIIYFRILSNRFIVRDVRLHDHGDRFCDSERD